MSHGKNLMCASHVGRHSPHNNIVKDMKKQDIQKIQLKTCNPLNCNVQICIRRPKDFLLSIWKEAGQGVECCPVVTEPDKRHKVFVSWRTTLGVGTGFWNVGNTWYVNAAPDIFITSGQVYVGQGSQASLFWSKYLHDVCYETAYLSGFQWLNMCNPTSAITTCQFLQKQEDSYEFLMFVMNASQKIDLHSEDSGLIHEVIGCYKKSQKCLCCGSTYSMFDPYLDIPLGIHVAQNVKQALTQSMDPEELWGKCLSLWHLSPKDACL